MFSALANIDTAFCFCGHVMLGDNAKYIYRYGHKKTRYSHQQRVVSYLLYLSGQFCKRSGLFFIKCFS